jgi:hypothetical protein
MKKLLAILVLCSSVWGQTLYIVQDMGETSALLEVTKKADENHDDYAIFARGTAEGLLKSHPKFVHIELDETIDRHWKRDALLSQKSVDAIVEKIHPDKVVSGVAFQYHGQLLQAFEKQGAKTYAYWDNINSDGSDSYFETAKKVAAAAQTLLAPSHTFSKNYPQSVVVGQPSLEMIPNPIPKPLVDIPIKHPLIVWVGGYGSDYNAALKQFLDEAGELKESMIILSYHPKFEGTVEKEMLAKHPQPNVFIYDAKILPSFNAIALSDVVVCHQSTVGLQAALGGKKVVYFTPKDQTYTNLLIENGITPQISSLKDLKTEADSSQDILDVLQVPRHAKERLYEILR